LEFILKYTSL